VIELGGVATAALADLRRRKGEQAYAYRAMSMFAALVALVFNVAGHWRPEERFLAFGFGGLSAFAYLLWLIHSSARRRDALRKAGQMATTGPVYGVVQWAREPKVTWLARSLALEHGYSLYESLRAAREHRRHTGRRVAIAGTVAEYIRSEQQDERLAKIAETTYDPDRLAGMLEERINYEVVTNKLTQAISPAPDQVGPPDEPAGGVEEPVRARVAEDQPNAERVPTHEKNIDDPDSDINDWWILMVETAGITTVDLPAIVPPQAPSSTNDSQRRPAPADTSRKAPSSFQAPAVVDTEFESREARSFLVSEAGVGALGAPNAPTDDHAPGLEEERSTDCAHQERVRQATSEAIFAQVSGVLSSQSTSLPEAPIGASALLEERLTNEGAFLKERRASRGALLEERPVGERFVAAADQERPSTSDPEIAAVERSERAHERAPQRPSHSAPSGPGEWTETSTPVAGRSDELEHEAQSARMDEERSIEASRNAATKSATGTKWDQAVRLLDDWPADTERTGTALAKLIGGSPSYARKLIVRYDQERRPARVLELVKTERSADIRPSTK
jgi:hypothetical protein